MSYINETCLSIQKGFKKVQVIINQNLLTMGECQPAFLVGINHDILLCMMTETEFTEVCDLTPSKLETLYKNVMALSHKPPEAIYALKVLATQLSRHYEIVAASIKDDGTQDIAVTVRPQHKYTMALVHDDKLVKVVMEHTSLEESRFYVNGFQANTDYQDACLKMNIATRIEQIPEERMTVDLAKIYYRVFDKSGRYGRIIKNYEDALRREEFNTRLEKKLDQRDAERLVLGESGVQLEKVTAKPMSFQDVLGSLGVLPANAVRVSEDSFVATKESEEKRLKEAAEPASSTLVKVFERLGYKAISAELQRASARAQGERNSDQGAAMEKVSDSTAAFVNDIDKAITTPGNKEPQQVTVVVEDQGSIESRAEAERLLKKEQQKKEAKQRQKQRKHIVDDLEAPEVFNNTMGHGPDSDER